MKYLLLLLGLSACTPEPTNSQQNTADTDPMVIEVSPDTDAPDYRLKFCPLYEPEPLVLS